jgi:hypothetical protein
MIRFIIDFNVSECDARGLIPKAGKSENPAEGSCG